MKKLAVIVSGWHFPIHFFREIAAQKVPAGWEVELYCVSHRDPRFSAEDKKDILPKLGWDYRSCLDRILYEKIATVAEIEALGWHYKEYPNTVGDWGNTNQWLDEHNYKDYDMLLVSHDDNLIPTRNMFVDLLDKEGDWLIITNSTGSVPTSRRERLAKWWNPVIGLRGSFELIKPQVLDMIGGKFDLGEVTLTREGSVSATTDVKELSDWNRNTDSMNELFKKPEMKPRLIALSPYYRVSKYCVEGERGFVSFTQPENTSSENKGFRELQKILKLS